MPVFTLTVVTGTYGDGQLHVKKKEDYTIEAPSVGVAGARASLKFFTDNQELIEKEKYYVQAINIKNISEPQEEAVAQVLEPAVKKRGRPPKNKV